MGLVHPGMGISFRPDMDTQAGPIGFLSQSGNLLFEPNHFEAPAESISRKRSATGTRWT
jgi:hypothetical protein